MKKHCGRSHFTIVAFIILAIALVAGCQVFQDMGMVKPDTPTGLSISNPTASSLTITWNSSSGAKSYQLSRGTSVGGPWTQVYDNDSTSYSDTGLSGGTTYYYQVRATNSAGSSAYTAPQSGTTTGGLQLTIQSDGHGTVSPSGTLTVIAGASTSISAVPDNGYTFLNWTVITGAANFSSTTSATTTMTLTSGNATIQANFTATGGTTYQLTLQSDGHGTVNPSGTMTVNQGAPTSISATPSSGYTFSNWTVVTGAASIGNTNNASTTVTLSSGNATVQANFIPTGVTTYQLTMQTDGHGTTSPAGTVTVNHGVATTIAATPSSGYIFANWTVVTGAASFGNANSASTTVTLSSGNATIKANFTSSVMTYQLTLTTDGHGTVSPTGTMTVNQGAPTSISATPSSGYTFSNWTVTTGTATFGSSTSASTTVTLFNGNATIKANFTASGLPAPTVSATQGTLAYQITVSWTAVSGAAKYWLYEATSLNGSYTKYNVDFTSTSVDIACAYGSHLFYKVTAVDSGGTEGTLSAAAEGWQGGTGYLYYQPFAGYDRFFTNLAADKGYSFWHTRGTAFYDGTFEIIAEKDSGYLGSGFGMVFGKTSDYDYYVFLIDTNGSYCVYRYMSGTPSAIKGWTPSSAIISGDMGVNHMKLIANGSMGQLNFYINGTLVYSATGYWLPFSGAKGFYTVVSSNDVFPGTPVDVWYKEVTPDPYPSYLPPAGKMGSSFVQPSLSRGGVVGNVGSVVGEIRQ